MHIKIFKCNSFCDANMKILRIWGLISSFYGKIHLLWQNRQDLEFLSSKIYCTCLHWNNTIVDGKVTPSHWFEMKAVGFIPSTSNLHYVSGFMHMFST